MDNKIFVVGHKNPDTDSICSAISYAYLKNQIEKTDKYEARRAGQINEETEFVLDYFKREAPLYMPNVGTQIRDITIDDVEGANDHVTVRIAWDYMSESGITALPIMRDDGSLEGMLSDTDIARYFMDAYSKTIMAEAKTKYHDIAETVNGEVEVGDPEARFTEGRVILGAASPEHFRSYIQPKDLVILADRADTQLTAIEEGASAIVICLTGEVKNIVRMAAEAAGTTVITTKFDTYTVARLINQAIPAKHLMHTDDVVCFKEDDFVDDVRETMSKKRRPSYPVMNNKGEYVGMIGSQNLMSAQKKHIILVDHTELSQAVDNLEQAEILEIIDHHRVGTVETINPVFFRGEPVGCTCTIVYSMFLEHGIEIPKDIAGLMVSAIISDTLLFRSPTCTPRDQRAGLALAKIAEINPGEYAKKMFRAGSALGNKTPEEILLQDFKKFIFGDTTFGVGQISSMDTDELYEIADKLRPQLPIEAGKSGMSMVFFMLTNIIEEDTYLLCYGKGADEIVKFAYDKEIGEDGIVLLPKVVSRKKQLIPAFMGALQNG
ncbi:MAG: putative manganese-dependent inorganic diphosphatase [Lachnospiraceae bacterium]|nr:putative manganese-dependent inorganic diphosphatase [Lachnospiraceae bacterium]